MTVGDETASTLDVPAARFRAPALAVGAPATGAMIVF